MALGKPFINNFLPFDARTAKTIDFIYNGEDFNIRQYRISYQTGVWVNSNEINSTWTITTKEYIIPIAANLLKNDNAYTIQVRVGNAAGAWSEWSNGTYFWCFAPSSITISGELNTTSDQPRLILANNSYEFIGQYSKPNGADDWYSCQYILTKSDIKTGMTSIIGDSGSLFRGSAGLFPSYVFSNLLQEEDTFYSIKFTCSTLHNVVLVFVKSFTISFAQPAVGINAEIKNMKDDEGNNTGKIQIEAIASRITANNSDNLSTYKFVQDPNDATNFYLDLSDDTRSVDYSQGTELLDINWNIYIHVKLFKSIEEVAVLSPINSLSLSSKAEKNYFVSIYAKKRESALRGYYNAFERRFYFDYTESGITWTYFTNEILNLTMVKQADGYTRCTDWISILISKKGNDFIFSVHKI